MNLGALQAALRHFAAERDWQPYHTPKNLTTALMVEAAKLAEIFQWQTPEESQLAHKDGVAGHRIGEAVADVLLYLLQVADHCRIDIPRAVQDKLASNAARHPVKRVIARAVPGRASVPGTHVLLDYENVQPSDIELRALVPEVTQVWVFHGPHQRDVDKRFASFGSDATAVPISKTGKNALDFHLSFYMGYIASRNPESKMVIVANDKGYEPMLEHAKAMGFAVRRQAHGVTKTPATETAAGTAAAQAPTRKAVATNPTSGAKKVAAKRVAAKKAVVAKTVAAKRTAAGKAVPHTMSGKTDAAARKPASANKPAGKTPARTTSTAGTATFADSGKAAGMPALLPRDSAASAKRLRDHLVKMGDKRPTRAASLLRTLKSFLGSDASAEAARVRLIAEGVVRVDAAQRVSYPGLDPANGSAK